MRPWIFPFIVLLLTAILTGLGWSGTSIGVLQPGSSHVVAGSPRAIRSDEWNVATPLIVAQSHHGYAKTSADSLGPHDMDVLLDVPTKTWPTIFRPWDYGFFVFDVTHGFAFRWWMLSAVLLLGSYSLLLQLTRRVLPSVLFSVAIWASPMFHWDYLSISIASAGLGMACLAAFLAALERPRIVHRVLLLVVCGWLAVAFALILYPPFQIPVAILMVLVGLGDLWATSGSVRPLLRRAGPPLAAVLAGSLVVLAVYYLSNRTAIRLIESTVYPGRRRVSGGGSSLYQFFSAPYGVQIALHGEQMTFTNQSEIASFLPVAPYVLLQMFRMRLSSLAPRSRAQVAGGLVAFFLFLVWYAVGLPSPLAIITGLDRVEAPRALIGIGLAGLLLVALFSTGLRWSTGAARDGSRREASATRLHAMRVPAPGSGATSRLWRRPASVTWGALTAGAIAFGGTDLTGHLLAAAAPSLGIGSHTEVIVSVAMGVTVFLLAAGAPVAGGTALALLGLAVTVPSNPLYEGLAPYTSTNLTGIFTSVTGASSAGWVSFAGPPVQNELIASGLRTVNSTSFYPVPSAWKVLDPQGTSSHTWNRYANLSFQADAGLAQPALALPAADQVHIALDPCGTQLPALGVGFVVSPAPIDESCLTEVKSAQLLGAQIYIYRISAAG